MSELALVERRGDALMFGDAALEGYAPAGRTIDGRTVVAGRLPPGAERAVVIDDRADEFDAAVGDGVYVAVAGDAGFAEPLVRFEAAGGALVARPLPDGPRTRVGDAPEACPVCAAVAWATIGNAVLCERCGHVEAIMAAVDAEPELELDAEAYQREQAEALAAVSFPVYAVPGRAASAGLVHGEVFVHHDVGVDDFDHDPYLSVATGVRGDPRLHAPRELLASLLGDGFHYIDRSPGGMHVAVVHRRRAARRRVARAGAMERLLVIDGRPEPFVLIGAGDAWVAARDHGDVRVTVTAREIEPEDLTLEPLAGRYDRLVTDLSY